MGEGSGGLVNQCFKTFPFYSVFEITQAAYPDQTVRLQKGKS
jgi:hypothetical protein